MHSIIILTCSVVFSVLVSIVNRENNKPGKIKNDEASKNTGCKNNTKESNDHRDFSGGQFGI